jgi:hypothetical protein
MPTKKRKHRANKTFKRDRCSPSSKEEYTCYSKKTIMQLKKYWNARHIDNKITATRPKEIWAMLRDKMQHVCYKESCWLKQQFIKDKLGTNLLEQIFAPSTPLSWTKNPNEWLNSLDILKVMKQYEVAYPEFDFMGPTPIDWNHHKVNGKCVWEELCKFNLKRQIAEGKTKIGIIFNLDKHNKGGSHWVALYISVKHQKIIYWDSIGKKTPPYIKKFIDKVKTQGKPLKRTFTVTENKIAHQHNSTECGVYCLHFIIEMLKLDKPVLFKTRISDKTVEQFRKIYFNE